MTIIMMVTLQQLKKEKHEDKKIGSIQYRNCTTDNSGPGGMI